MAFHSALLDAFTPSMEQKLDLDRLWRRAVKEAEAALEDEGAALTPDLPRTCPFMLDELLAEAFFREALAQVCALAGEVGPTRS